MARHSFAEARDGSAGLQRREHGWACRCGHQKPWQCRRRIVSKCDPRRDPGSAQGRPDPHRELVGCATDYTIGCIVSFSAGGKLQDMSMRISRSIRVLLALLTVAVPVAGFGATYPLNGTDTVLGDV